MIESFLRNLAFRNRHADIVNAFLKAARTDDEETLARYAGSKHTKRNLRQALKTACEREYGPCVQVLLEHASPEDVYNTCMQTASRGPAGALPWLLAHAPQWAPDCLCEAAKNCNVKALSFLIGITDPKADNSLALQWAVVHGFVPCIDLLYPVSDPRAALEQLKEDQPPRHWMELEMRIQRDILMEATVDCGSKRSRKM